MARELLKAGDQVLITSRSQSSLEAAMQDLQRECGDDSKVDVWINNAAYSGAFQPFTELSTEQLAEVVSTNLMGVLYCSRQALSLFAKQPGGYGHLFNMDGAGADGLPTPNYAAYGATKAGILQLTRTLEQEAEDTEAHVHMLSPGMILTNLLLEGATTANKQAFNLLAEHPETPAAFLVPRIRTAVARGLRGTYAKYLTPPRILLKLLSAPFYFNKFFDEEGNAVYLSEHERIYGRGAKSTERRLAAARSRKGGLQVAYSLSLAFAVALCLVDASYGSGSMPR
ncbi:hypothetical protein DUNSADRAFT_585 [Dunaliella salina]|uniref:Uncharacterized protein n=1 Tax=Dunaliella salina TaxID=3046 RepID=A0ABQ7GY37_DUNSA|nr:hypothetical protein DUNSADRAFT_585 [Dunaliella salina]|eukprot:KAF5839514.1 hypothetical protein DUNSADRAFT_585 [Dunaliella salina]